MKGMEAIAEATATIETANNQAETTSALWLVFLLGTSFPLMNAWVQQISHDQLETFADTLNVLPTNPGAAAKVAADYQQTSEDQANMQKASEKENNLVQGEKSQLTSEENAMTNVFSLDAPILGAEQQTRMLIATGV